MSTASAPYFVPMLAKSTKKEPTHSFTTTLNIQLSMCSITHQQTRGVIKGVAWSEVGSTTGNEETIYHLKAAADLRGVCLTLACLLV